MHYSIVFIEAPVPLMHKRYERARRSVEQQKKGGGLSGLARKSMTFLESVSE